MLISEEKFDTTVLLILFVVLLDKILFNLKRSRSNLIQIALSDNILDQALV